MRSELQYALVAYPLSRNFAVRLEHVVGPLAAYLSVGELRQLSLLRMLAKLRSLNAAVLHLPLEDEGSHAVLPALKMIALFARAGRVEVVYPDMRREPVSKLRLLGAVLAMAGASFASLWVAVRCWFELKHLLKASRIRVNRSNFSSVHYLKTNLWFGVKAGGSVGHIAGVVNEFARRGLKVVFFAAEQPTMVDGAVRFEKVPPPRTFGVPSELNYYRYHKLFVKQLSGQAAPAADRFIYQRMSIANYTGVVLSRKSGVPLILEYNGSEVWVAKHWGRALRAQALAAMAEEVSLRHAHVVVTVSDVLRDDLLRRGVQRERIVVYPNCIDERIFDPARFGESEIRRIRELHGIARDAVVVTFIGTFGRWHGADVLARAIRNLVTEKSEWLRRNKVKFLLVGDGHKLAEVREILAGTACTPFVVMTGLVPQREAPSYLAASDVLLSPHVQNADGSHFFGSPTKLFEYMAMGKGIVASDLDQIGEVLAGGLRTADLPARPTQASDRMPAVLVRPGDMAQLIEGVRFLVERPDWRERLGQNARGLVLTHYTWRHHVDKILSHMF